jgi:hypothetical protein
MSFNTLCYREMTTTNKHLPTITTQYSLPHNKRRSQCNYDYKTHQCTQWNVNHFPRCSANSCILHIIILLFINRCTHQHKQTHTLCKQQRVHRSVHREWVIKNTKADEPRDSRRGIRIHLNVVISIANCYNRYGYFGVDVQSAACFASGADAYNM